MAAPPNDNDDRAPGSSGSIDVRVAGETTAVSDGAPEPVGAVESLPVPSGKVPVPATSTSSETTGRTTRLANAAKEKLGEGLSAGVSALGTGLGTIGEGVSKLGEKSKAVPLVGAGMSKLGENLSHVGESLHELPRVAKTRRGRLLVRSLIVGFVLVASWIVVIVALQLKSSDAPDFRPVAEKILIQISSGVVGIEAAYDQASPRFQEMARKEKFVDEMSDLAITVGDFKEITSINDTLVTSGPVGRVGRVSLTVAYEKATCKASVSLHEDRGEWKLLGVGIELPLELEITQAQREERIQACKDPMARTCDLNAKATEILERLRDGQADLVWDDASPVFQKQEERARFIQLQAEHTQILGPFIRLLAVSEARVIGGTTATFDAIVEFARAHGVRATFSFFRLSKTRPWKLRSMKIVLPMPRADEQGPAAAAAAAGSGNGPGSGSPLSPTMLMPPGIVRDAGL